MKLIAWVKPITLLLWAVSFLTGLWAEGLGSAGMIHLLSPPVLGTLGWNLFMYGVLLLSTLWTWRRNKGLSRNVATNPPINALQLAWGKRALHGAAVGFTLGLMASMYIRGVLMSYSAAWSSTFLSAEHVHALLYPLLGPAATWLGDGFPRVEHIASLRFMGTGPLPSGIGESAARWIHWYALTLALWVIVPRLLLLAWQHRQVRKLEKQWQHQTQQTQDLDDKVANFRPPMLLDEKQYTQTLSTYAVRRPVRLFMYNLPPQDGVHSWVSEVGMDRLSRQLSQHMIAQGQESLQIVCATSLNDQTLADEAAMQNALSRNVWTLSDVTTAAALQHETPIQTAVVLFSIAQTPEMQTHGRFLQFLREQALGSSPVLKDGLKWGAPVIKAENSWSSGESLPLSWPQNWMVALDETPFHQRFKGVVLQNRLQERRRAWVQLMMQVTPELKSILGLNLNMPEHD